MRAIQHAVNTALSKLIQFYFAIHIISFGFNNKLLKWISSNQYVFYDDTLCWDAASCASLAAASATLFRFRQAFKYVTGVIGKRPDKPLRSTMKKRDEIIIRVQFHRFYSIAKCTFSKHFLYRRINFNRIPIFLISSQPSTMMMHGKSIGSAYVNRVKRERDWLTPTQNISGRFWYFDTFSQPPLNPFEI